MPIKTRNAVVFDMDGVLIDSEHNVMKCEQTVCQRHGIEAPAEAWQGFKGRTSMSIFTELVERWGAGREYDIPALIQEKRQLVIEQIPTTVTLLPGADRTLELARQHYDRLALVTSSSAEIVQAVFSHFGLHQIFNAIVTGDDVEDHESKPHPRPYQQAFYLLRALPDFVIEDADNGVLAAHRAGAPRIIGLTSSFPAEVLRKSGATDIVANHDELRYLLFS